MDMKYLNKKFIGLLKKLDVETDQFPDKSFDGLFETKRRDVDYFLEWFLDNITCENVLAKAEVGTYNDLKNNHPRLFDDDSYLGVIASQPRYQELNSVSEEYVTVTLATRLKELDAENESLRDTILHLECKHNELKKKQNELKEECHKEKKKLLQLSKEFYSLNSRLDSLVDQLGSCKSDSYADPISFSDFTSLSKQEEKLVEFFSKHLLGSGLTSSLPTDKELCNANNFKDDFITSKYLSTVSRVVLTETAFKVSKAEEFMHILEEENKVCVTFDEALNNWCNFNNIRSEHDASSIRKSNESEFCELTKYVAEECEYYFCQVLSEHFNTESSKNEEEISKLVQCTSHLKRFVTENLMLLRLIDKTVENEKKCARAVEKFALKLSEDKSKVENIVDTLKWKRKRYGDHLKELEEKHPLARAFKKLCAEHDKALMEDGSIVRTANATHVLLQSLNMHSVRLFSDWESKIAALASYILSGPTSQILLKPIELQIEFFKCQNLISKHSHEIKQLLTDYLKAKDVVSSGDRSRLLLWMNFLRKSKASAADRTQKLSTTTTTTAFQESCLRS